MDEETLEVSAEENLRFKKSLRCPEKELLEIFPESKIIIPEKLAEWECKEGLIKRIIKKRLVSIGRRDSERRVKRCDSFTKWFLRELVKHWFAKRLVETKKQTVRLRSLLSVSDGTFVQAYTFSPEQISAAELVPIENFLETPRMCGQYISSLCPFHQEKTPSFFIFSSNRFKCFGCGEHGNAIDFIQKQKGLNFPQAVKFLLGQTR